MLSAVLSPTGGVLPADGHNLITFCAADPASIVRRPLTSHTIDMSLSGAWLPTQPSFSPRGLRGRSSSPLEPSSGGCRRYDQKDRRRHHCV
ncbi:protein of unknown function [Micropruina glycogenica]|uniref:Uncharacterized protein n=1 Tax=Micropruina glycogenica TaxID=75385 RepID=A0A2N9JKY7_9ACTN|nr:protein of unknown function [Micropruina glycogenica]